MRDDINYQKMADDLIAKKNALEERVKAAEIHTQEHRKDYQSVISKLLNEDAIRRLEREIYVLEYKADVQKYM